MTMEQTIILAAGGTGGHLTPALALADDLVKNNAKVILITDERCKQYLIGDFPFEILCLKSVNLSLKPLKLLLFIIYTFKNIVKITKLIYLHKIRLMISFGGYTAFAANISAVVNYRKLILHEQNSVAGRLNKLFACYATKIFCNFPKVRGLERYDNKTHHTGFLVENYQCKFARKAHEKFTILIVGGSQGASFLADFSYNLLSSLDQGLRKNIKIIQQVKQQQHKELAIKYDKLNIEYELSEYFNDIKAKYLESDFVIARSGASTMGELINYNLSAIYIPYPFAMNDHQYHNASYLAAKEASFLYRENEVDYNLISNLLQKVIKEPQYLKSLAQKLNKIKNEHNPKLIVELLKKL